WLTSHLTKAPPISAATASPFSCCMSAITTMPPLAASMRAVPSPRPDAPPVTTNTLPWISILLLLVALTLTFTSIMGDGARRQEEGPREAGLGLDRGLGGGIPPVRDRLPCAPVARVRSLEADAVEHLLDLHRAGADRG